ncbi:MAG TPA: hypothetical protein VHU91_09120 [Mycobacteriales bacterium]|nr:hypothetical protein [Mycobacteriales bacterium]
MCRFRLGHPFPYLPKQPGYHKRLKAAAPLICQATLCPSWGDDLRMVDATPIPSSTSRQTVRRSDPAGWDIERLAKPPRLVAHQCGPSISAVTQR